MDTGAEVSKRFYKEITDIQVYGTQLLTAMKHIIANW